MLAEETLESRQFDIQLNAVPAPPVWEGHARAQEIQGQTVTIGSKTLYLAPVGLPPKRGEAVRLLLEWPKQLDDRIPLGLFIGGIVSGVKDGRVCIFIERHEFRTRKAD